MNFEFMTIDTPLPPCMPFPRALTGFPVICNFSEKEVAVEIPEEFRKGSYLIANYPEGEIKEQMTIRPYEAFVLEK